MLHDLKENIKARFKAKRYDIWKEQVVEKGNDKYFIYNDKIYYGNRFFVFFYSEQNTWYKQKLSNRGEW
jgi:hypothetical protein